MKFLENFDEAYRYNFSVITFHKIFESSNSETKLGRIEKDHSHSNVDWVKKEENQTKNA